MVWIDQSGWLCAYGSSAVPLLPVRLYSPVRGYDDRLQDGTSGSYRGRHHSIVYGLRRAILRKLPSELHDVVDRVARKLWRAQGVCPGLA